MKLLYATTNKAKLALMKDYVEPLGIELIGLDYGYLKGTNSMDGGGIDVWRGRLKEPTCNAIICTVDLIKRDSEIKVLLGCTEQEKETVLNFHNDSDCMKGILIERNGGQNERK